MVGNDKPTTLQVEGVWIDEGAELIPYHHTLSDGEDRLAMDGSERTAGAAKFPPKTLEIVTDLTGGAVQRSTQKNKSNSRHLLGGVTGWEYLLGEMFGSDHVTISTEGMCLIPNCLGGRGSPAGLANVFFQRFYPIPVRFYFSNNLHSGPAGSEEYNHPWAFRGYTPDVIARHHPKHPA